jgi:hypothetical protein
MAPRGRSGVYVQALSPSDKRLYFWAIGIGTGGLACCYVGRYLLFKGGRNTGSTSGWVLLLVGLAICLVTFASDVRLILRGRSIVKMASECGTSDRSLDVIYDASSWTESVRSAVNDALSRNGITSVWDGNELKVDQSHEFIVDQAISS